MTALTNLLERLSKLERAGTVAQWQVRGAYVVQAPRITRDVCRVCSHLSTADGELIAAARNSLPTLLQMLRVASEALTRYEGLKATMIIREDEDPRVALTIKGAPHISIYAGEIWGVGFHAETALAELNRLASEVGI